MRPRSHLEFGRRPTDRMRSTGAQPAALVLQSVPIGTVLFEPGDPRRLYRIENGAMTHFMKWPDGRHGVIEFAFAGDIIGLGHTGTHSSHALAMVDSLVAVLTEADLAVALSTDDVLSLRQSAAADREFDYLQERALRAARSEPPRRLASYLIALARMNGRRSGGTAFVSDEDCTPHAAQMLAITIDGMAKALSQLHALGLIAAAPGGLAIGDIAALERFADGN